MPAFITHQIFAKKISEKLKNKNFDKKTFEVFSQSHDLFYYYTTFNKKEKKIVFDYGKKFHRNKTQDFIVNIIKIIKTNKLENDHQAIGFLYGIISHYVLDSTIHPYIFYKTGIYNKKDSNSFKYRGLHNKMERNIDIYYYEKYYHKSINKIKILKLIPKLKFSNNLKELIDLSYKNTYNKKNISSYLIKAHYLSRRNLFLFSQDRFGIKKYLFYVVSFFKYRNKNILGSYSYNHKVNNAYFNSNRDSWLHPSTKQKFNYSVEDLFNQSLKISLYIINEVNKIIYTRNDVRGIEKLIPDLSYITGLPISKNNPLVHFEF